MRKILLALTLVLLASVLVSAEGPTEGALLMFDFDQFEGSVSSRGEVTSLEFEDLGIGWYTWDDYGEGRRSEIAGELTDDAYYGKQAVKITYVMDAWCGHGFSRVGEESGVWDWSDYDVLSFWIKGDGNRHEFQISMEDMDGEEFRSPSIRVTDNEWKQIKIRISNITSAEWQQPDVKATGRVKWPIKAMQIAPVTGKGELIIDLFELHP